MWLVRRVILVTMFLAVLCAGMVVVARANRTPSRLQALGFDVCDGEPCWRGIKPGMDWERALGMIPSREPIIKSPGIKHAIDFLDGEWRWWLQSDRAGTNVQFITVERMEENLPPLRLGEVISFYGVPSCVDFVGPITHNWEVWEAATLIYPRFQVTAKFPRIEVSLQPFDSAWIVPDAPIRDLQFPSYDACSGEGSFPWRGFQLKLIR